MRHRNPSGELPESLLPAGSSDRSTYPIASPGATRAGCADALDPRSRLAHFGGVAPGCSRSGAVAAFRGADRCAALTATIDSNENRPMWRVGTEPGEVASGIATVEWVRTMRHTVPITAL